MKVKSDFYSKFSDKNKTKHKGKLKYQDVKGKSLSDPSVKQFLSQFDEAKQAYYQDLLLQSRKVEQPGAQSNVCYSAF